MFKFKTVRMQRIWQFLVLALSFVGLITMLEYGARLNQNNFDMLSEQTQSLSRIIARQAASTASDDILDKDQDRLQALVNRISDEPLILDASVYDLEGSPLAQTEDAMPLEQISGLTTPLSTASIGRQQIVQPVLTDDGQIVGYLRLTLEHGKLVQHAADQIESMTNTVRGLVIAALFIGFVLAYTFGRRKDVWHFPFLLTANAKD
ncbi:YtjB family periplasmic protein [Photobacterium sp. CCB-ST2H9]|uniref:YtjB family periplasmic protein n=1 Tax=unclassified Photobacterium TaxID=2628852 RepID=UPI00200548B9|nr:AhpA/YtjB family protein [Photobacterium sp. CCB-ST2H9]UTM56727.1 YtjB family periplasmic protein [Photobacterium sp. CCB-ST2H9]